MQNIRWVQRFENFSRAFKLLEGVFFNKKINAFSELEKEGIVLPRSIKNICQL